MRNISYMKKGRSGIQTSLMTKKDYIYNGVYLTLFICYYLFNVELFHHEFKKYEWCDFFFDNVREELSGGLDA